jgi:PhnB protein
VFDRAIAAGATELMPVEDSGDGDRRGGVTDPCWHVATYVEASSRQELQGRHGNAARQ